MKQVVLLVVAHAGASKSQYKVFDNWDCFLQSVSDASGYSLDEIKYNEDVWHTLVDDLAQQIIGEGELVANWQLARKKSHLNRLVCDGKDSFAGSIAKEIGLLAAAALRDLAQTPEPPAPDIVILTDANGWPSGVFTFGDNARPIRYVIVSENDVKEGAITASESHISTPDGHFKDFAAVEAEIHSRI